MSSQHAEISPSDLGTLIIVILDESGSMNEQKSNVIGGYNNFITEQRELKSDRARFILVKFSTYVQGVAVPLDLADVPMLYDTTYNPGGWTALYDAIKEGIQLGETLKLPTERILVIIMTDGEENSSKTSAAEIRNLISQREAEGNWTFTYIGVAPEKWAALMAQNISNTAEYNMVNQGENFIQAAQATTNIRMQSQAQLLHGLFDHAMSNSPPTSTLISALTTTTVSIPMKKILNRKIKISYKLRPRNKDGYVKKHLVSRMHLAKRRRS